MDLVLILGLAIFVLLFVAFARTRRALGRRDVELEIVRQERDQERGKEQEWMDTLANTTSLGLLLLDAHGRITFINRAARTLLEIEDGIGKAVGEIAWSSDLEASVDYVLKQKNESVDQTIVRGERAFAARLRGLGQEAHASVLVELAEVTELQRLGRARREFVANISHELRTPLTSLQLLMETMNEDRLSDRSFALEFLGKMRLQIDVLRQLTNELMDLALIESGQAPIKLVETAAADLFRQSRLSVGQGLEHTIKSRHTRIDERRSSHVQCFHRKPCSVRAKDCRSDQVRCLTTTTSVGTWYYGWRANALSLNGFCRKRPVAVQCTCEVRSNSCKSRGTARARQAL